MVKNPPIEKVLKPVSNFIHRQYAGGIVLLAAVIIAIIWANSGWSASYHALWHLPFGLHFGGFSFSQELHVWINDMLMAIFFFVIGLELKREFMVGELSTFNSAILPIVAAVGGMLVPAGIYYAINAGGQGAGGWGIPMATDIAFALALLAMAGKGVPSSVKVFLSALAVADDLGAVLVIALFYTKEIVIAPLLFAALLLLVAQLANRLGVRSVLVYTLIGLGVWLGFFASGVHATIAGVLLAFTIPSGTQITGSYLRKRMAEIAHEYDIEEDNFSFNTPQQHKGLVKMAALQRAAVSPVQALEDALHPWVAFVIMPLFALANAGMHIGADFFSLLLNPISMGIMLGLVLGKFIGVSLFTWLMVKLKVATLPADATWRHILGVSLLAGIGFTMSLFITNLAFNNELLIDEAKYGILLASICAGVLGIIVLKSGGRPAKG